MFFFSLFAKNEIKFFLSIPSYDKKVSNSVSCNLWAWGKDPNFSISNNSNQSYQQVSLAQIKFHKIRIVNVHWVEHDKWNETITIITGKPYFDVHAKIKTAKETSATFVYLKQKMNSIHMLWWANFHIHTWVSEQMRRKIFT